MTEAVKLQLSIIINIILMLIVNVTRKTETKSTKTIYKTYLDIVDF